ncbi:MAG: YncE family protein, partial [Bryobacteraceae bacterium]
MKQYAAFGLVTMCAAVLCSQTSPRVQVGRQPDGSFLLPTGWRLEPVGKQIPLDTLPMSSTLSKDGKFLLVLNGGYKPPSISVIDIAQIRETSRVPVADGWLGLAFSPDGNRVYAGGGAQSAVFEFTFSSSGELKPARTLVVTPPEQRTEDDFIGDVAVSPDGRTIYAADLFRDSIVAIDARSGVVTGHFKTSRRPYRILFHPDGKAIFVSNWADGTVSLLDASTGNTIGQPVRVGPHPTDMVLSDRKPEGGDKDTRYRLFVAAANTNNVFVVGVGANREL